MTNPVSGFGRNKEAELMLAKANLDEIEEISAKQIPADLAGRESGLKLEGAKIVVNKPDRMNRRSKVALDLVLIVDCNHRYRPILTTSGLNSST
ncbi:MAG: hypothetical protein GY856_21225 [bacterium]|nr:hypothetical protein [bacterium]